MELVFIEVWKTRGKQVSGVWGCVGGELSSILDISNLSCCMIPK